MKKLITLLLLLCTVVSYGQFGQSAFYKNDTLRIQSDVLEREVIIPLFLPMEHYYCNDQIQLPLILIFDSQHTLTFPYHLHSIDAMTTQVQMPASVVAGIPFGRDRTYLTSNRKREGEDMSGQQKMEAFLWEELIPAMEKNFHAYPKPILLGHSRSAYLVSWLMCQKPDSYAMTMAASGFYEPGFEEADALATLQAMKNGSSKFFFSNGTLREESTYQADYHMLSERLYQENVNDGWHYEEFFGAGHMANYQLSVPWALTTFFEPYAGVLDEWLFETLENNPPAANESVATLHADFKEVSNSLGVPAIPRVIHYFSIGSHYANNNAPKAWTDFMKDASEVYPKDYVYHYLLAEIAKEDGDVAGQQEHYTKARQALDSDIFLNAEDRGYAEEEVESIRP